MNIRPKIPQMMIKEMEPIHENKELTAILQYVSNENGWGKVISSISASSGIKQDGNTTYVTIHFECELENSLIKEITLTTKGYINNNMYRIEEVTPSVGKPLMIL